MTKRMYYSVFGNLDNQQLLLFGSFSRSEVVDELDAERHNWRGEGYRGFKIKGEIVALTDEEIAFYNREIIMSTKCSPRCSICSGCTASCSCLGG